MMGNCLFYRAAAPNWSHKLCDKSFTHKILLLCEAVKNAKCHAYIGDVPLQVYDSCHLLSDVGFIDGQSTVGADQLRQVNHELLVGLTCLSNTDSFIISDFTSTGRKGDHWFELNHSPSS